MRNHFDSTPAQLHPGSIRASRNLFDSRQDKIQIDVRDCSPVSKIFPEGPCLLDDECIIPVRALSASPVCIKSSILDLRPVKRCPYILHQGDNGINTETEEDFIKAKQEPEIQIRPVVQSSTPELPRGYEGVKRALGQSEIDITTYDRCVKALSRMPDSTRKQELLQEFSKNTEIKRLEAEEGEIGRIKAAFADNEGYKVMRKKKFTMWHRKEADKTITLKFEAEMELELQNLFYLLYETQIYHLWFPNCKKATLVHSFNKTSRMLHAELATPGLMANRETIMHSVWADRLEREGRIFILAKSVNHLQELMGVPIPSLPKGRVALDVKFFGFEIAPGRETTLIRSVFNFNPHVKFVPQWLLNVVNKHFGKMLFERMLKQSRGLKPSIRRTLSKIQDREAANSFYDWILTAVEGYLRK